MKRALILTSILAGLVLLTAASVPFRIGLKARVLTPDEAATAIHASDVGLRALKLTSSRSQSGDLATKKPPQVEDTQAPKPMPAESMPAETVRRQSTFELRTEKAVKALPLVPADSPAPPPPLQPSTPLHLDPQHMSAEPLRDHYDNRFDPRKPNERAPVPRERPVEKPPAPSHPGGATPPQEPPNPGAEAPGHAAPPPESRPGLHPSPWATHGSPGPNGGRHDDRRDRSPSHP
jgi:hypothetical protein